MVGFEDVRKNIKLHTCELVLKIESIKCRKNNGYYPQWSAPEFNSNILSPNASMEKWSNIFYKEVKYTSDGDSYYLYFICNLNVDSVDKLTVIKVINSSIYWRDDFAPVNKNIDELDGIKLLIL